MDVDQHGSPRRRRLRREHVEQMPVGGAVFDVAPDLDALIGLLLLQRRVERSGLGRVDDAAEFQELPGQIFRHRGFGHRALLGERRGREHQGRRQSRYRQSHSRPPPSIAVFDMADAAPDSHRFRRDDSRHLR
ncbi:hypothetical protein ABIF24_000859 [Bradyrhizobium elkanii]|uniref:hypothetical protein n=1 Tax=Bradyrhizobium elkanii TaxID=29448 RepID=UPI0035139DA1